MPKKPFICPACNGTTVYLGMKCSRCDGEGEVMIEIVEGQLAREPRPFAGQPPMMTSGDFDGVRPFYCPACQGTGRRSVVYPQGPVDCQVCQGMGWKRGDRELYRRCAEVGVLLNQPRPRQSPALVDFSGFTVPELRGQILQSLGVPAGREGNGPRPNKPEAYESLRDLLARTLGVPPDRIEGMRFETEPPPFNRFKSIDTEE